MISDHYLITQAFSVMDKNIYEWAFFSIDKNSSAVEGNFWIIALFLFVTVMAVAMFFNRYNPYSYGHYARLDGNVTWAAIIVLVPAYFLHPDSSNSIASLNN